jgi:hypothetical protein
MTGPHVSGNAAWTETSSTPVRATNLENFEAVLDNTHPFAGLRNQKLNMLQGERVTLTQNTELTIANITGPGCVRSIWFAIPGGSPAPSVDTRLRIYYDGSASAAVDMDLGTLFAMHYGGGSFAGTHYTPHISAQMNSTNANAGYLLTLPIPFGTSIKIACYNPDATISGGNGLYYMVTYDLTSTDWANGRRFQVAGPRIDAQTTVTATQNATLASITGVGWVVALAYVGGIGATNITWMERDFQFQVDGESVTSTASGAPAAGAGTQVVTTGTEDTFDSAWYFNGWRDFMSSQNSYVAQDVNAAAPNQYVVCMVTDFWSKWGGIPFNSSCVATLLHETACTTGHSFSLALMYYA